MRDLLFKNLTSSDRKKRIIASSEVTENAGLRSIIQRHFICMVREVKDNKIDRPKPYLYVLKEHNRRAQREKFFCRIKGGIYAISEKRVFLILFMHSLKITLTAIPDNVMEGSA